MIRNFLYFIVGCLIAFNAVFAFAARNCPPSVNKYISGSQMFDSPAAACAALVSGYSNIAPYQTSETGYKCAQGYYSEAKAWLTLTLLCDDLTAPDSFGMCECPDPCKKWTSMYHNGGSPSGVRLPGGDAGGDRNYYSGTGTSVPISTCIDNCTATFAGTDDFSVVAGNSWSVAANPIFTGKSCGDTTAQGHRVLKTSAEYDCVSAGKGFGFVNGAVVCTKPDAGKDTSTKSTITPNADGTSTKTDVTKVINCSGDGSCVTQTTTTTTTISASGVPGTSYTNQTVEKSSGTGSAGSGNASQSSSFCVENPQSTLCAKGSFSGSCASEPACDGDPVMCATARATWKTRCALETSQQVATQGQNILDGQDSVARDALVHKSVDMQTVDTTGGGASGSCPADKQVPIGDKTLTIPFSSICGGADLMKIALLAIATFTAGMIIVGGIK